MSIRILSVIITPTETTVGQPIQIVVAAEDIKWNNLKTDFTNWGEVKASFANWNKVLNYIYTKPTVTTDCVYSSDGQALFDVANNQLSITGGYTSQYSADIINNFVGEVLNE